MDWYKNKDNDVLVIGEIAQAHDGSLGAAHAYIDAIADAGADVIKFQTHIAAAESTRQEPWRVKFSYEDDLRYDYWERMQFTEEQWIGLKEHAENRGLIFLSTPFSVDAAKMLDRMGMTMWKISSGEVSDPWLLEYILSTKKPIIFSTGMSTREEVDAYAKKLASHGAEYALLQCTTNYPVAPERVGLNVLDEFIQKYPVVGLSDHSGEMWPSLAAVTMGAKIIEVHVCLSKYDFGPDVPASLTNDKFAEMIRGIRFISKMKNNPVNKDDLSSELSRNSQIFAKSVCAKVPIAKGTVLTKDMLALKKPANGIPAREVNSVLGKTVNKDFAPDDFIQYGDVN